VTNTPSKVPAPTMEAMRETQHRYANACAGNRPTGRAGDLARQAEEDVVRIGCAVDGDAAEFGGIDFHDRTPGSMIIFAEPGNSRFVHAQYSPGKGSPMKTSQQRVLFLLVRLHAMQDVIQ